MYWPINIYYVWDHSAFYEFKKWDFFPRTIFRYVTWGYRGESEYNVDEVFLIFLVLNKWNQIALSNGESFYKVI